MDWQIFVTLFSALWIGATFIRDRRAQSVERNMAVMNHLFESNKLSIENPDIQKYISQNAWQEEYYFHSPAVLNDPLFFKAKTFVYARLNSFDEILSLSSEDYGFWDFLLKPAELTEIDDWEEYIIEKLRHPLYRSILKHEGHIFGESLRDFWNCNIETIKSKPADRHMW